MGEWNQAFRSGEFYGMGKKNIFLDLLFILYNKLYESKEITDWIFARVNPLFVKSIESTGINCYDLKLRKKMVNSSSYGHALTNVVQQ